MSQRVKIIKIISIMTVFFFSVTNIAVSQNIPSTSTISGEISAQSVIPGKVIIPQELGSIQEEYHSKDGKSFVVFIQDAHAIVDAQTNIQNLINYFSEKYGVSLVALEGGKGKLDPTLLRAFPDEKIKRKVMEEYLDRGELAGAVMASILNPFEASYFGIEDWPLYEAHYIAYLRAMKNEKAVLEDLDAKEKELDAERSKIYSPEHNEFHEKVTAFRGEKLQLLDFLKYLKLKADSLQLTADQNYPHVKTLMDSIARDSEINYEMLDREIRNLCEQFRKESGRKLTKDQLQEFNGKFQEFVTGRGNAAGFLKYLISLSEGLGTELELSPSMKSLLGHEELLCSIKGTKVFEELEEMIGEAEEKLSASPEEKDLGGKYGRLAVLRDMAKLELNREKLEKIQAETKEYLSLLSDPSLIKPHFDFYGYAVARDEVLQKNLEELMAREKKESAIVILGGFHRSGFETRLKEKGISFCTITPRINCLTGAENYDLVMEGELSYKEYLKTTFYDAFMRSSSMKLVAGLNEPDFRRVIKVWRDGVIRRLAEEGRIAEANEYTKYVDLLVKVYVEKFGTESIGKKSKEEIIKVIEGELARFGADYLGRMWKGIEKQFEMLGEGLKGLIGRKEFTEENVQALLDEVKKTNPAALQASQVVTNVIPGMKVRECALPMAASLGTLDLGKISEMPAARMADYETALAVIARGHEGALSQTPLAADVVAAARGSETALTGAENIAPGVEGLPALVSDLKARGMDAAQAAQALTDLAGVESARELMQSAQQAMTAAEYNPEAVRATAGIRAADETGASLGSETKITFGGVEITVALKDIFRTNAEAIVVTHFNEMPKMRMKDGRGETRELDLGRYLSFGIDQAFGISRPDGGFRIDPAVNPDQINPYEVGEGSSEDFILGQAFLRTPVPKKSGLRAVIAAVIYDAGKEGTDFKTDDRAIREKRARIREATKNALIAAYRAGLKKIAFTALGTGGMMNFNSANEPVSAIYEGIRDFQSEYGQTGLEITIAVIDQKTYETFIREATVFEQAEKSLGASRNEVPGFQMPTRLGGFQAKTARIPPAPSTSANQKDWFRDLVGSTVRDGGKFKFETAKDEAGVALTGLIGGLLGDGQWGVLEILADAVQERYAYENERLKQEGYQGSIYDQAVVRTADIVRRASNQIKNRNESNAVAFRDFLASVRRDHSAAGASLGEDLQGEGFQSRLRNFEEWLGDSVNAQVQPASTGFSARIRTLAPDEEREQQALGVVEASGIEGARLALSVKNPDWAAAFEEATDLLPEEERQFLSDREFGFRGDEEMENALAMIYPAEGRIDINWRVFQGSNRETIRLFLAHVLFPHLTDRHRSSQRPAIVEIVALLRDASRLLAVSSGTQEKIIRHLKKLDGGGEKTLSALFEKAIRTGEISLGAVREFLAGDQAQEGLTLSMEANDVAQFVMKFRKAFGGIEITELAGGAEARETAAPGEVDTGILDRIRNSEDWDVREILELFREGVDVARADIVFELESMEFVTVEFVKEWMRELAVEGQLENLRKRPDAEKIVRLMSRVLPLAASAMAENGLYDRFTRYANEHEEVLSPEFLRRLDLIPQLMYKIWMEGSDAIWQYREFIRLANGLWRFIENHPDAPADQITGKCRQVIEQLEFVRAVEITASDSEILEVFHRLIREWARAGRDVFETPPENIFPLSLKEWVLYVLQKGHTSNLAQLNEAQFNELVQMLAKDELLPIVLPLYAVAKLYLGNMKMDVRTGDRIGLFGESIQAAADIGFSTTVAEWQAAFRKEISFFTSPLGAALLRTEFLGQGKVSITVNGETIEIDFEIDEYDRLQEAIRLIREKMEADPFAEIRRALDAEGTRLPAGSVSVSSTAVTLTETLEPDIPVDALVNAGIIVPAEQAAVRRAIDAMRDALHVGNADNIKAWGEAEDSLENNQALIYYCRARGRFERAMELEESNPERETLLREASRYLDGINGQNFDEIIESLRVEIEPFLASSLGREAERVGAIAENLSKRPSIAESPATVEMESSAMKPIKLSFQLLSLELPEDVVASVINIRNDLRINNPALQDRGEVHLTIIAPNEISLFNQAMATDREEMRRKFEALGGALQLKITGVGFVKGKDQDAGKMAYFMTVDCQVIQDFRAELGLAPKDLHITIGFIEGDVHGVSKIADAGLTEKYQEQGALTLGTREVTVNELLARTPGENGVSNETQEGLDAIFAERDRQATQIAQSLGSDIRKVAETLPAVQQIRESLKPENGGAAVILGAPGSGKTEQLMIALGTNMDIYDLRGRFLKENEGLLVREKDTAGREIGEPVSVNKATYLTSNAVKQRELEWLNEQIEDGLAEKLSAVALPVVIVFDEFDLALRDILNEAEMETASLIIKFARNLRGKKGQVVLIIHSKGSNTAGFNDLLVQSRLMSSVNALIRTRYFQRGEEEKLLGAIGIEPADAVDFLESVEGIPAAYLGLLKHMSKLFTDPTYAVTYAPTLEELWAEAKRTIGKNYDVISKTENPVIVKLLMEIAAGVKTFRDREVIENQNRLLDTGLIGIRGGRPVMPQIVKEVITGNLTPSTEKAQSLGKGLDEETQRFLDEIVEELRSLPEIVHTWAPAIAVFGSARVPKTHPYYLAVEALGGAVAMAGYPIRTGAAFGAMQAASEGYQKALIEKFMELVRLMAGSSVSLEGSLGVAADMPKTLEFLRAVRALIQQYFPDAQNGVQGIPIKIPHETTINPFVDAEWSKEFRHMAARIRALYENVYGVVLTPGGFGTYEEWFRSWRLGLQFSFYVTDFWEDAVRTFEEAWEREGILDKVTERRKMDILITDDPETAVDFASRGEPFKTPPEAIETFLEALQTQFSKIYEMPPAVAFVGRPRVGSEAFRIGTEIAQAMALAGLPVRVTARRELFDGLYEKAFRGGWQDQLSAVLFLHPTQSRPLTDEEKSLGPRLLTIGDESAHQILMTSNTSAVVFLPGAVGTMDKLFELLTVMQIQKDTLMKQTGKPLEPGQLKPILLVGKDFWQPIMDIIREKMLDREDGLKFISSSDLELFMIVGPENVGEAIQRVQQYARLHSGTEASSLGVPAEGLREFLQTKEKGRKTTIPKILADFLIDNGIAVISSFMHKLHVQYPDTQSLVVEHYPGLTKGLRTALEQYRQNGEKVLREDLLSKEAMEQRTLPRIEMRKAEDGEINQIVIAGPFGDYRAEAALVLTDALGPLASEFSVREGGISSLEINLRGVDKSLPIDFLSRHFDDVLAEIGYTPGPLIDARKTRTVVLTDGDGTIYGEPGAWDPLVNNMTNSEAREPLIQYLEAGGVYVLVSGNEVERTRQRLIMDGAGIPRHLWNRILVVVEGSAIMHAIAENGNFYEIESYRNKALSESFQAGETGTLDAIYAGDKESPNSNDAPGFIRINLIDDVNRAVMVSKNPPSELSGRFLGGNQKGTGAFLAAAVEEAERNPGQPLFTDEKLNGIIERARTLLESSGFQGMSLGSGPWTRRVIAPVLLAATLLSIAGPAVAAEEGALNFSASRKVAQVSAPVSAGPSVRRGSSTRRLIMGLGVAAGTQYLLQSLDRGFARQGRASDDTLRLLTRSLAPVPGLYFHEYAHAAKAYDLAPDNFREPGLLRIHGYSATNILIGAGIGMMTGKLSKGNLAFPIYFPSTGTANQQFRPSNEYPTLGEWALGNPRTLREICLAGPLANFTFGAVSPKSPGGLSSLVMGVENLSPYGMFDVVSLFDSRFKGGVSDGANVFREQSTGTKFLLTGGLSYLSYTPQGAKLLSEAAPYLGSLSALRLMGDSGRVAGADGLNDDLSDLNDSRWSFSILPSSGTGTTSAVIYSGRFDFDSLFGGERRQPEIPATQTAAPAVLETPISGVLLSAQSLGIGARYPKLSEDLPIRNPGRDDLWQTVSIPDIFEFLGGSGAEGRSLDEAGRRARGEDILKRFREVMQNRGLRNILFEGQTYSDGAKLAMMLEVLRRVRDGEDPEGIVPAASRFITNLNEAEIRYGVLTTIGEEYEVKPHFENPARYPPEQYPRYPLHIAKGVFENMIGGQLGADWDGPYAIIEYANYASQSFVVQDTIRGLLKELGFLPDQRWPSHRWQSKHTSVAFYEDAEKLAAIRKVARYIGFADAVLYTDPTRIEFFASKSLRPIDVKGGTGNVDEVPGPKPAVRVEPEQPGRAPTRLEFRLGDTRAEGSTRMIQFMHGCMLQAIETAFRLKMDPDAKVSEFERRLISLLDDFITTIDGLGKNPDIREVLNINWFSSDDNQKLLKIIGFQQNAELSGKIRQAVEALLSGVEAALDDMVEDNVREADAEQVRALPLIRQLMGEMEENPGAVTDIGINLLTHELDDLRSDSLRSQFDRNRVEEFLDRLRQEAPRQRIADVPPVNWETFREVFNQIDRIREIREIPPDFFRGMEDFRRILDRRISFRPVNFDFSLMRNLFSNIREAYPNRRLFGLFSAFGFLALALMAFYIVNFYGGGLMAQNLFYGALAGLTVSLFGRIYQSLLERVRHGEVLDPGFAGATDAELGARVNHLFHDPVNPGVVTVVQDIIEMDINQFSAIALRGQADALRQSAVEIFRQAGFYHDAGSNVLYVNTRPGVSVSARPPSVYLRNQRFVNNALYDGGARRLFIHRNAAASPDFWLGQVLTHERGKRAFFNLRERYPNLRLNRVSAEIIGKVFEFSHLLQGEIQRVGENAAIFAALGFSLPGAALFGFRYGIRALGGLPSRIRSRFQARQRATRILDRLFSDVEGLRESALNRRAFLDAVVLAAGVLEAQRVDEVGMREVLGGIMSRRGELSPENAIRHYLEGPFVRGEITNALAGYLAARNREWLTERNTDENLFRSAVADAYGVLEGAGEGYAGIKRRLDEVLRNGRAGDANADPVAILGDFARNLRNTPGPSGSSLGGASVLKPIATSPENSITVSQEEFTVIGGNRPRGEVRFLQTYGLGPCIGLVLWDEKNKVGGIAHLDHSVDQQSIARFMRELIAAGAEWENLNASLVGGMLSTFPEFLRMIRETLRTGDAKDMRIVIDEAVDSETVGGPLNLDGLSIVLDLQNWAVGCMAKGSQVALKDSREIPMDSMLIMLNRHMPEGERLRERTPVSDAKFMTERYGTFTTVNFGGDREQKVLSRAQDYFRRTAGIRSSAFSKILPESDEIAAVLSVVDQRPMSREQMEGLIDDAMKGWLERARTEFEEAYELSLNRLVGDMRQAIVDRINEAESAQAVMQFLISEDLPLLLKNSLGAGLESLPPGVFDLKNALQERIENEAGNLASAIQSALVEGASMGVTGKLEMSEAEAQSVRDLFAGSSEEMPGLMNRALNSLIAKGDASFMALQGRFGLTENAFIGMRVDLSENPHYVVDYTLAQRTSDGGPEIFGELAKTRLTVTCERGDMREARKLIQSLGITVATIPHPVTEAKVGKEVVAALDMDTPTAFRNVTDAVKVSGGTVAAAKLDSRTLMRLLLAVLTTVTGRVKTSQSGSGQNRPRLM